MALRDFQESRRTERIIFSWPVIALAAFLCLAALWGILKILRTELVLRKEIGGLQKKIDQADAANANFEERVAVLRTEDGLDREARGKLNLKKPGEEVVVFVGDKPPENVAQKTGLASVLAWIEEIFNFHFSIFK